MSLTDLAVRAARPGDNPQRMFDGGGLYLEVAPSGSGSRSCSAPRSQIFRCARGS